MERNLNSDGQEVSKQLKQNGLMRVMEKIEAPPIPKGNNPLLDFYNIYFLNVLLIRFFDWG